METLKNLPTFPEVMAFNALFPQLSELFKSGYFSMGEIKEFMNAHTAPKYAVFKEVPFGLHEVITPGKLYSIYKSKPGESNIGLDHDFTRWIPNEYLALMTEAEGKKYNTAMKRKQVSS